MWLLTALTCVVFFHVILATSKEKCGTPDKPINGHVNPNKPVYNHGDKAELTCDNNYFLHPLQGCIQTCQNGTWSGLSVCLRNQVYGQDLAHFGTYGHEGVDDGGNLTYAIKDRHERVYASIYFPRKLTRAYVSFNDKFVVTGPWNSFQTLSAFNENLNYSEVCNKLPSGHYFECNALKAKSFTGAKMEIRLQDSTNLSVSPVTVRFYMKDNAFVVLSPSVNDCDKQRINSSRGMSLEKLLPDQNSSTPNVTITEESDQPSSEDSLVNKNLKYICISIGLVFSLLCIGMCWYWHCRTRSDGRTLLFDNSLTTNTETLNSYSSSVNVTVQCSCLLTKAGNSCDSNLKEFCLRGDRSIVALFCHLPYGKPPTSPIPGSYPLIVKTKQLICKTLSESLDESSDVSRTCRQMPLQVPSPAGPRTRTINKPYLNVRPPNWLRALPDVNQIGRNAQS